MRSLLMMSDIGYPVIYDATHSVQQLSGPDGVSGGAPQFIEPLARSAIATGAVSGVFVETHPRPAEALSDRASMLPLERLLPLIQSLVKIVEALDIVIDPRPFMGERAPA
jgi:2-dehydro-3-deoxyphosphooctonate aldolase (KDO 8-P synthase)